jgi:hypothetical protein
MAFTTGTLGTATTTSLTKAIVWGAQPTSIYGTSAGLTKANYAANYVPCLADLNASFQYADSYDTSQEDLAGSVSREWAAIVNGILYYPGGRGMLKLYPYDVIACDTNTGWPVLINKATSLSAKWHVVPNI